MGVVRCGRTDPRPLDSGGECCRVKTSDLPWLRGRFKTGLDGHETLSKTKWFAPYGLVVSIWADGYEAVDLYPTVVVDSDIDVLVFFSLHDLKTLYMERKVTFLIS